jgi:Bacterial transcriptional activator domain
VRLTNRGHGYLLQVKPSVFDLHLFRQAVGLGREYLARGDLAGAAEQFAAGLALWRGEPLETSRAERR